MKLPHLHFYLCALIITWHPDRPGARWSHEYDPTSCRYKARLDTWVKYLRNDSRNV